LVLDASPVKETTVLHKWLSVRDDKFLVFSHPSSLSPLKHRNGTWRRNLYCCYSCPWTFFRLWWEQSGDYGECHS